MTSGKRFAILGVVLALFVGAFVLKEARNGAESTAVSAAREAAGDSSPTVRSLPRLVDLGSDKCIPCKMMAPILEELKREYQGRLIVEVIDVRKDRAAGAEYGITVIPTQIFLGPAGKELYRHEGFYSKEDILAKWKALGIGLESTASKGRKS